MNCTTRIISIVESAGRAALLAIFSALWWLGFAKREWLALALLLLTKVIYWAALVFLVKTLRGCGWEGGCGTTEAIGLAAHWRFYAGAKYFLLERFGEEVGGGELWRRC